MLLAPILLIIDLPEIETILLEIETILPEIKTVKEDNCSLL